MEGRSPLADVLVTEERTAELGEIEKSIAYLVKHMPSHEQYLAQYCPAPPMQDALPLGGTTLAARALAA